MSSPQKGGKRVLREVSGELKIGVQGATMSTLFLPVDLAGLAGLEETLTQSATLVPELHESLSRPGSLGGPG